jgi:hypothetical protein
MRAAVVGWSDARSSGLSQCTGAVFLAPRYWYQARPLRLVGGLSPILLHKNSSPLTSLHKAPSVTARCVLWAVKKTRWKRSRKWMPSAQQALAACAIVPVSICCACFFLVHKKKTLFPSVVVGTRDWKYTPLNAFGSSLQARAIAACSTKQERCLRASGWRDTTRQHTRARQAGGRRAPTGIEDES